MKYILIILLPILFLNFCAPSSRFASKKTSRKTTNVRDGETIIGYASYYADKFHGRQTANGEIFNMHDYTAAHRNLPFDTVLLVTNLENGKKVKVRINDRGPFSKGRVIDLSYRAMLELEGIEDGLITVKVKVIK